jgi:hypothetical protein
LKATRLYKPIGLSFTLTLFILKTNDKSSIMDLTQTKLTKAEWDSVEIPPSKKEMRIMRMIIDGYTNLDISVNRTQTLLGFLKMEQSDSMDEYLFNKFMLGRLSCANTNAKANEFLVKMVATMHLKKNISLKSADKIRMQNAELLFTGDEKAESDIYELFLVSQIVACVSKWTEEQEKEDDSESEDEDEDEDGWQRYYYTLAKMSENMSCVSKVNYIVKKMVAYILTKFESDFDPRNVIFHASEYVEQNTALMRYKNEELYSHQKELFAVMKQPSAKLVLYIAPTGTGKTLSPIGIDKKIIFVCAARHIGLALARTAISVDKKIAFAFGASCADDVRLHYAAAKEYTKNRKSGKIQKVDNTKGEKVEIMICDIKSYIPAMLYMLAFNSKEDIVMYWDEVTISMDYDTHVLHDLIRTVWAKNVIPNVVFSSATVPSIDYLGGLRASFDEKFPEGSIHTIHSFDCIKSISMIDPSGYVALPHTLFGDYDELQRTIAYWESNGTILRYFDAKEVGQFIEFVELFMEGVLEVAGSNDQDGGQAAMNSYMKRSGLIESNFHSVSDITMTSIKQHYMRVLKSITSKAWPRFFAQYKKNYTSRRIQPSSESNSSTAGVYVTTKDAYTLTDGPTYFFTADVGQIAKFYVQQANIPASVMDDIMAKINHNSTVTKRIDELEHTMEDLLKEDDGAKDDSKKGMKATKDVTKNPKVMKLQTQIEGLRNNIKIAKLNDLFVPNKPDHLKQYHVCESNSENINKHSLYFTSSITDDIVVKIMQLNGIDDTHKILLLMGIGVFSQRDNETLNPAYLEVMKMLASHQRLYLIIANSDYMWGTNYQACHAYFSKDLCLTQDKILQGMGRVGRGDMQQEYTVRFRSNDHIRTLLCAVAPEDKLEIVNMNKLFGPFAMEETIQKQEDAILKQKQKEEKEKMDEQNDTNIQKLHDVNREVSNQLKRIENEFMRDLEEEKKEKKEEENIQMWV